MWLFELRQLKKQAHSLRLTENEKSLLGTNLLAFMKVNPLEPVRMKKDTRQILHLAQFSFLNHKYMYATLIVLLMIATGGGVSYAAERTAPGDPLYGVKQFNEEIRAVLTVSPQAEAKWDARRVERRLEEATTLAAKGKLNAEAEAQLTNKIKAQVKETKKKIKRLETNDNIEQAAELSTQLKTTLLLHSQILSSLQVNNTAAADEATTKVSDQPKNKTPDKNFGQGNSQLLNEVRVQTSEVNKIKVDLDTKVQGEAQVNVEVAAQAKIASAKHKVKEVKELIAQKSPEVSAETKAEARIVVAEKLIVEAEAKVKAKLFTEAFNLAKEAHEVAQEAQVIISTQSNVKVDLQLDKVLKNNSLLNNKIEIKAKEESAGSSQNSGTGNSTPGSVSISQNLDVENSVKLKTESKPIEVELNSNTKADLKTSSDNPSVRVRINNEGELLGKIKLLP